MSTIFNDDEFAAEEAANSLLEEITREQESSDERNQAVQQTLHEVYKRIEEANLWKVLIEGEVFSAGSARTEILNNANNKIRDFALEQVELLLGLKEKQNERTKVVQEPSQFESDEIQALKVLAATVLKKKPSLAPIVPKPAINQVSVKEAVDSAKPKLNTNTLNKHQTSLQKSGNTVKASQSSSPRSNSAPKKGDKQQKKGGQTLPSNSKGIPMPRSADDVIMAGSAKTGVHIVEDENSTKMPAGLMQSLISGLTNGGAAVAQLSNNPEEVDINEFQ